MYYCSHNANSREVKESPQVKSGIVRILRMSSNALRQYKRARLRGRKGITWEVKDLAHGIFHEPDYGKL